MSTKSTNSIDDKEIIDRFLEFAEKSRQRFNDEIKDFRDTRAFASGDQDVATSLGKGRMSSRANIIPRVVAAVVNPVRATPYDVSFQLSSDDGNPELSQTLNQWKTDVFDRSNSKEIFCRAMKESTTYGLGGFYVTTVRDEFTEDVHCEIDIIDDPTMIVRDPFSRDDSGADSEKTAVIEIISKSKAKREFGEDAARNWDDVYVKTDGLWNSELDDGVQLVTYYEKDDEGVHVYKLVGDSVVSDDLLPIRDIPVVLVKGQIEWGKGNTRRLIGLAQPLEDVQMIINYAQSQLGERLKRAPKVMFSVSTESFEGNEKFYENSDKNMSPVLLYKGYTKDGKALNKPERMDNTVATQDLQNTLDCERGLIADISGVSRDLGMVEQESNETAEGLLLKAKATADDVSHFREHLRASVKQCGKLLLQFYAMISQQPMEQIMSSVKVQVERGPELAVEKMEMRRKLLAIQGLVPDAQKPIVAFAVVKTMDDSPEMSGIAQMMATQLPPEVFQNNAIVQRATAQLQQQLQQAQQQLSQSQQQINDLNQQLMQVAVNTKADLAKAAMENQNRIQLKVMDLQAKNADAQAKAQMQLAKATVDAKNKERELNIMTGKVLSESRLDQERVNLDRISLLKGMGSDVQTPYTE